MTASLAVSRARDEDAAAWQAYILDHPQAVLYHAWGWRTILHDVLKHKTHYLVARRNGRLAGVLPLAEVKTLLFGHFLSSLPLAASAGPLGEDDEVIAALEESAADLARSLSVGYLEYRNPTARDPERPQQDLYVTFRKAISLNHEDNLQAVPRKQRAMVRKGAKSGLVSETGDLDAFFNLYADNMHRHGTPPMARRFFERLSATFGQDAVVLTIKDAGGKSLSGVVAICFRNVLYALYAGDTREAREVAANDFKYAELMALAAARGCREFDYGRSKRGSGQFDFKKNWGFVPVPLAYEYLLVRKNEIPANNPMNPKFRLLIATWRRMPRWAVNAVGPALVRGLV